MATLFAMVALPGCGQDDNLPPLHAGEAEYWTQAVSHILIRVDKEGTNEVDARERVFKIHDELLAGASFESLARRHSEHDSRGYGGFLGFVPIGPDSSFSGAVQALAPGATSRPVHTELGFQIIHRHPLDEGIELEKRLLVSVYGFILPFRPLTPAARYSADEAHEIAARVYRECKAGATTLEVARHEYTDVSPSGRTDAFLMVTGDKPDLHDLFQRVRSVAPGEPVPPFDTPTGVALVRRGQMARVVGRHIVIKHFGSFERPLHVIRTTEEARVVAAKALAEIKPDRSNWAEVVQKYTDDDTTLRPMGELGLTGPGDVPLPIENALAATPPGQLHPEVVESLYGFHILWRVK